MTRGKYGVKAAKAVAEHAVETTQELKAQLARERKEHAAEVVELKAQLNKISGQLTHKVDGMASAAVNRARREAREAVEAERADMRRKNLEAYRWLSTFELNMGTEDGFALIRMLGLEPGEALADLPGMSREVRRMTNRKLDKALDRFVQKLDTGAPDAPAPDRR